MEDNKMCTSHTEYYNSKLYLIHMCVHFISHGLPSHVQQKNKGN